MTKLAELFRDIQNDKNNYVQALTGKDFENRISNKLDRLGYNVILASDINQSGESEFQTIKEKIQDHTDADLVGNPTDYKRHYIHEPYGSQDYPDYLVFDGGRIIPIEVKFSGNKQARPVWNSGLPRISGIYIFGSYGLTDVTFFRGSDVLSPEEIKTLHQFFEKEKKRQDEFNANEMSGQKYGFSAYSRKAFDQKRRHNEDAVIDFFRNPERDQLEERVIEYVGSGQ